MTESSQLDKSSSPSRSHAILRKAKKGAIRVGIGVLVVMLTLSIVIRVSQFGTLGWSAFSILFRYDLLIALSFAALGALVGGATGAILGLQGTGRRKAFDEPKKRPLD